MKVVKSTKDCCCGSFFGSIIWTTRNRLTELFGEIIDYNDTSEKVQFQWNVMVIDDEGEIICEGYIYDWKEYRYIGKDEKIEWHIGGKCEEDTKLIKELINKII